MHVRIFPAGMSDLYAPSVDRLFKTASDAVGSALVAVVLTGMGDDGAASIRDVKSRGGRTIAESSQTAIIFGMPGEAIKTGCVESILSLPEIPNAIHRLCIGPSPA
jgi:two-component system chemotaxis response regulator CheB